MRAGRAMMTVGLPLALMLLAATAAFRFALNGSVPISPGSAAGQGPSKPTASDPRLTGTYRFERDGWIYVHLEGSPEQVGFQHGYMLAPEIEDAFEAIRLDTTHRTQRDWAFFRKAAREMLWPKVDPEYKEELQGIVEG